LYNGLIGSDNDSSEWSRLQGFFGGSMGVLNIREGKLDVKPDRFSPSDTELTISPLGIEYIQSIIAQTGNQVTFGSLMDSQMAT